MNKYLSATSIAALATLFAVSEPAQATDIYNDRTPSDAYVQDTYQPSSDAWTGIYGQVFGGFAWGDWRGPLSYDDAGVDDGFDSSKREIKDENWFGGVGVGADKQFGQIVAGLVVDVAYGDLGDTNRFLPYPDNAGSPAWEINTEIEAFGTARGRLGYLLKPNLLAYATGGLAWAKVDASVEPIYKPGKEDEFSNGYATADSNHLGWAAGAGMEWKLTNNISVFGEYLYIDLGEVDYRFAGANSYDTDNFHPDLELQIIKAGLNYRF